MSRILVTGIAGLLGSHVAEHLISLGHYVVGIDNFHGGYKENIPHNCDFVEADLINAEAVDAIVKAFNIEYIYHFAAYAAVGLSPFIRNFNYTNNVLGSVNLINAAIKYDIKKFVFASSMDVYGEQKPPFTENMRPNPQDPYGIAKYAIEMDLANAKRQFGLDYWIVRPHNIIGPRQNIWDKYRNVAGIWIRKAMAGEPLTVYGDGTQRRAFSDVKCYMQPFETLMHLSADSVSLDNPVINIGADEDVSINDLANIVADVAHKKMSVRPTLEYLEPRDEVKNMWCDHSRAKDLLDFKDNTDLYGLIEETWDWAVQIKPKPVKYMEYEIEKGVYSYWRK